MSPLPILQCASFTVVCYFDVTVYNPVFLYSLFHEFIFISPKFAKIFCYSSRLRVSECIIIECSVGTG